MVLYRGVSQGKRLSASLSLNLSVYLREKKAEFQVTENVFIAEPGR
jgi:hypothetical protein